MSTSRFSLMVLIALTLAGLAMSVIAASAADDRAARIDDLLGAYLELGAFNGAALVLSLTGIAPPANAGEAPGAPESLSEPVGRIPFTVNRARVMVPVQIGDLPVLHLTLDTGMPFDGVYLFHREVRDRLPDVEFMEVRVPGAGAGEPSHAVMAESMTFTSGGVEFTGQMVVVSTSPSTQSFPSDGVIGMSIVGAYVVEIDYDNQVMNLYDPVGYRPPADWERLELTVQNNIPFLDAVVSVTGDDEVPIRVYIDLAASDALELLVSDDAPFAVPDSLEQVYLGTGLSGDIHGGVGRVARLTLGSHDLTNVVALFPPAAVRSKQEGADGILGNDVLRRFQVVFDYFHGALYLRPNRSFKEPFWRNPR